MFVGSEIASRIRDIPEEAHSEQLEAVQQIGHSLPEPATLQILAPNRGLTSSSFSWHCEPTANPVAKYGTHSGSFCLMVGNPTSQKKRWQSSNPFITLHLNSIQVVLLQRFLFPFQLIKKAIRESVVFLLRCRLIVISKDSYIAS